MSLSNTELQALNELLMKMEGNDFHTVANMFKYAQTMRQHKAACAFKVGDTVQWQSKYGKTMQGTIAKVNTKSIKIITTTEGQWSVSPSLLTKA